MATQNDKLDFSQPENELSKIVVDICFKMLDSRCLRAL